MCHKFFFFFLPCRLLPGKLHSAATSLVYFFLFSSFCHCVKNVLIRSYSVPYFPAFGLNTERYFESLRIQSECGKIRTRIIQNRDTFHAVCKALYFFQSNLNVLSLCSHRKIEFCDVVKLDKNQQTQNRTSGISKN